MCAAAPEPFERLNETAVVTRLVTLNNVFIPPGAKFPVGAAFYPSSGDKAEAARRGRPVTVSVWDRAWASAEQAQAFRPGATCRPYLLQASRLRSTHQQIDVVADPHEDRNLEGWQGHSGITGLERERYANKNDWKAVMERVAACAYDYE